MENAPASFGLWGTHARLPGRADRSHTNVGEAAARGETGGKMDEEAEKIVRTQRLVVGVWSISMQTDSPTCRAANHFLSLVV